MKIRTTLSTSPITVLHKRSITSYADKWSFREIRIPTPCGTLAAKDWGDVKAKPILALHGWQDNANSYDLLIPYLKPKYRIIALDFIGHGHSSHLAPGLFYGLNNFIMDIHRVTNYFRWDKVTLVGHSLGGGIAHIYCMLFPERVSTLVTIDVPLPGIMPPEKYVQMTAACASNILRMEQTSREEGSFLYSEEEIFQKHLKAIKGAYTESALRVLMSRGCSRAAENRYQFNRDRRLKYMFWNSFDAETSELLTARYKNELLAIRCLPMLFKRESYFEVQKIHKENCSRYEYAEVLGLHHIHLTDPEQVAPHINRFLDGSKSS